MSVHRILVFHVYCAAALLGAGCNSEPEAGSGSRTQTSETASTSAAVDPCSFLTAAEVAEVIGEQVVKTEPDDNRCSYQTEDVASAVEIQVVSPGGAQEMQLARKASGALQEIGSEMRRNEGAAGDVGAMLTESSSAPVIGDEAFFGANQQLHVLKNDVYFAVTPPQMKSRMAGGNPLLSAEQKREMAIGLAQKIASKLRA